MHDWSDPYSSKILAELRKVAGPNTKLLIVDNIVAHACHDPNAEGKGTIRVPGAEYKYAPAPLLANFGAANELSYTIDMGVSLDLVLQNAIDRDLILPVCRC